MTGHVSATLFAMPQVQAADGAAVGWQGAEQSTIEMAVR